MNVDLLLKAEKELTEKLNAHIDSGILNSISRGHNNASDIGFECDTFQSACRLKGNLRPRKSIHTEKIFRMGRILERPNIRWLQDAQIQVRETSDKRWEWPQYNIVGYMEADIKIPSISKIDKFPLEHKTVSPNGFRAVKWHKEHGIPLTQARQPWTRKYPGQLTTYMLFKGQEIGVWFYFEKQSGDFLWWIYPLDYTYGESLIQRAERCNENVAKEFIPPCEQKELCNDCDFAKTLCFPDKDYGPGFVFMSDEQKEEKLMRREKTKEAHAEYLKLDKELKGHFKGKNVVTQGFKIESKQDVNGNWRTSIEKL